jgi:hypothetical protein
LEFSTEKVSKNSFYKKFHGIFCGKSHSAEKNVQKIGPWSQSYDRENLQRHE